MVDTLYQWYKKYGDACEEFSVGFVGSPEEHEALMTCLLAPFSRRSPCVHCLFDSARWRLPLFHVMGQS